MKQNMKGRLTDLYTALEEMEEWILWLQVGVRDMLEHPALWQVEEGG